MFRLFVSLHVKARNTRAQLNSKEQIRGKGKNAKEYKRRKFYRVDRIVWAKILDISSQHQMTMDISPDFAGGSYL
jgi:hypothetical protein